jgi:hypothetical protein
MPRDEAGRWQKGSSGNPGGRPAMATEVREALCVHTPDAVAALVQILQDATAPAAARVAAARCILDHSIGKPLQAVAIASNEGPRDVEHMTTPELEALLASMVSNRDLPLL